MGALTLKTYPFELRGWDIEKFESVDPTDGFGLNTRIYISKNQIVQIEPEYDSQTLNTWLTDKGRQFFDGIFGKWSSTETLNTFSKKTLSTAITNLIKTLYMFEHCNAQTAKKNFFTIIFEDVSLELLGLLNLIAQNYSCIKLRKAQKGNNSVDLEHTFQINSSANKENLKTSNLCLLVGSNPRYEGFNLNLRLRQRFLKGDFKCLSIGSIVDLTFPTNNIGSNTKILKSICEGNHIACQDFKFAKNPLIIFNNEVFKRLDGKNLIETTKMLSYSNILNKTWMGLNILNSAIYDINTQSINNYKTVSINDILNASSLYLIHVSLPNSSNFKTITKSKLLNFSYNNRNSKKNKIIINQTLVKSNDNVALVRDANFYYDIPVSMFYENDETFINTEGYIKKTSKVIFTKKTKSSKQVLKKTLKELEKNLTWLSKKNNNIIFFKENSIENFLNFQYYSTKSLTNLNFKTSITNSPFIINKNFYGLKLLKITNTKIKYWLDDFFIGGKDSYSRYSLVMVNSSNLLRAEGTNFF